MTIEYERLVDVTYWDAGRSLVRVDGTLLKLSTMIHTVLHCDSTASHESDCTGSLASSLVAHAGLLQCFLDRQVMVQLVVLTSSGLIPNGN